MPACESMHTCTDAYALCHAIPFTQTEHVQPETDKGKTRKCVDLGCNGAWKCCIVCLGQPHEQFQFEFFLFVAVLSLPSWKLIVLCRPPSNGGRHFGWLFCMALSCTASWCLQEYVIMKPASLDGKRPRLPLPQQNDQVRTVIFSGL